MKGFLVAAIVMIAACRRNPETAVVPVPMGVEEYCWWATWRTLYPLDTVVERTARAHGSVGLSGARRGRLGDTAWVESGPAWVTTPERAALFARAVAIRHGDTTFFRHFLARSVPVGVDTSLNGRRHIEACGEITRAAQLQGTAPREPDDSSTEPRWRRRR